ncbi:nitric oxide synthase-interacting protein homolog [Leptinotarsa decemlineata]|uniref:nitric oxide synthase-interacting protein homolog n=1 Tax=Leptinotarsa decemlineata TaxID=7539 RepID=UPI003D30C663
MSNLISYPDDKKSIYTRESRYMCAVTHDILSSSVPCAVLIPIGDATMEYVRKIIKKDYIHRLMNKKISKKDIIIFRRGGTEYAPTNDKLSGETS